MGHNNILCEDVRKVNKKSTGNGYDGNVTEEYMLLIYGTGVWYWYHQRRKLSMVKNSQDKNNKWNYSVIL
jgi:hypothetical protein